MAARGVARSKNVGWTRMASVPSASLYRDSEAEPPAESRAEPPVREKGEAKPLKLKTF